MTTTTATLLETGQGVRWRGRRWRVLAEEQGGFLTLVGVEPTNRDQVVHPHVLLEAGQLEPDVLPLPPLDVEASDRSRWRALHQAHMVTMAGGREQLRGLDWGAVAVEPYQLVPLVRVARTVRPRLLVADDTGLGKTAEAGIVLRWLAQRHQANRVLIVTRAAPEPKRWQEEMWVKFGFRFDILSDGADFAARRRQLPTVNVFAQQQHLIVSMTLAARDLFLGELEQCRVPFDVVIVDEAHHLAERGSRTKQLTDDLEACDSVRELVEDGDLGRDPVAHRPLGIALQRQVPVGIDAVPLVHRVVPHALAEGSAALAPAPTPALIPRRALAVRRAASSWRRSLASGTHDARKEPSERVLSRDRTARRLGLDGLGDQSEALVPNRYAVST